jgi:hypothetical protein
MLSVEAPRLDVAARHQQVSFSSIHSVQMGLPGCASHPLGLLSSGSKSQLILLASFKVPSLFSAQPSLSDVLRSKDPGGCVSL